RKAATPCKNESKSWALPAAGTKRKYHQLPASLLFQIYFQHTLLRSRGPPLAMPTRGWPSPSHSPRTALPLPYSATDEQLARRKIIREKNSKPEIPIRETPATSKRVTHSRGPVHEARSQVPRRIFSSAALAMKAERVSPCAAASSSIAYLCRPAGIARDRDPHQDSASGERAANIAIRTQFLRCAWARNLFTGLACVLDPQSPRWYCDRPHRLSCRPRCSREDPARRRHKRRPCRQGAQRISSDPSSLG